jgi:hypothetical protein
LLLPACFLAHPQTAPGGTIQGIILRGETNEPIPNVRLVLGPRPTQTARNGSTAETTTDNDGRFIFANLEPGQYVFRTTKTGYVAQVFPGQEDGLKLAAGQVHDPLTVRLAPTGSVTGRIIDSRGQALGNVPVQFRDVESQTQGLVTRSNDRGEYRFFFLTPGRYVLSAGQEDSRIAIRTNGAARTYPEEFALLYYPGVADRPSARIVSVKAGEELAGLDIVMGDPQVPTPRVPATPPTPVGQQGIESATTPPQNRGQ